MQFFRYDVMKKCLKKLSVLMLFLPFLDISAEVLLPPEGCLDDLKELYQELQKEENQGKNLLDILKNRMEKTVYGYSKAYLDESGAPVNSNVQQYLKEKIEQNTQKGFDTALDSTFKWLKVDISSFPQSTRSVLGELFGEVDNFIIKGLLSQSSCEGLSLCDEQVLEGFHGLLMNINNDPVNSTEAKKILEDEYTNLSDRFAEVLARKLREYVAEQQENEQCRDFLSSVPTSVLDSVNPLLLLGCDKNSGQTPLPREVKETFRGIDRTCRCRGLLSD